jgi:hypothetical protein
LVGSGGWGLPSFGGHLCRRWGVSGLAVGGDVESKTVIHEKKLGVIKYR